MMVFEKSDSIKEIAKALGDFQADVEKVAKTAENPFYHSKYAPLDAVIEAIKAPLKKHGLSFSQLPDGDGLTTIIMHTSGEYLAATAKLELKEANPQQQGSAITYMRRYALAAGLGLATEDDNDGNGPAAPKGEPKTAPKAKETPTGDSPTCPKCEGDMWDNKPKKASGEYSPKSPDFKCKDKNCDGTRWPKKKEEEEDDYDQDLVAAQAAAAEERGELS